MDGKKHVSPYLIGQLIVITIQIAGFAFLWNEITSQQQYIYLPTVNSQGSAAGTQVNPVVAVTKFPTESILREMIESVLKQELAPYTRQLAAAPQAQQSSPSTDPPGVKENSPDNIRALSEARNIINSAIAQGKWTRENNVALIPHVPQLTQAQRYQIMDEIGQAINRQELKIEDAPPAL